MKRYNFNDYIARTAEYSLQANPQSDRFFTADYLKLFLEDLLAGRISPSLLSEEEVQIPDRVQGPESSERVQGTSIVGRNFNAR